MFKTMKKNRLNFLNIIGLLPINPDKKYILTVFEGDLHREPVEYIIEDAVSELKLEIKRLKQRINKLEDNVVYSQDTPNFPPY